MILKFVYSQDYGEIEGVFDENDNLIHTWDCNDATWRHEYFNPLLEKLGFKVIDSFDKKLIKKLIKAWK